jgi:microcystin-dependent protein
MPCNGYVLNRELYFNLFSAIGTTYNTGGESANQFRIHNYNNEKRFLQAATVAGKKTEAWPLCSQPAAA